MDRANGQVATGTYHQTTESFWTVYDQDLRGGPKLGAKVQRTKRKEASLTFGRNVAELRWSPVRGGFPSGPVFFYALAACRCFAVLLWHTDVRQMQRHTMHGGPKLETNEFEIGLCFVNILFQIMRDRTSRWRRHGTAWSALEVYQHSVRAN